MVRLLGAGTASGTGVSSFGAFAVGTAARFGTGNLAGVALAIAVGGPGAIFWMWVIALVGAATAFVESTLAQVYKVRDGDTFRFGRPERLLAPTRCRPGPGLPGERYPECEEHRVLG